MRNLFIDTNVFFSLWKSNNRDPLIKIKEVIREIINFYTKIMPAQGKICKEAFIRGRERITAVPLTELGISAAVWDGPVELAGIL